jgi:hypothetical protein
MPTRTAHAVATVAVSVLAIGALLASAQQDPSAYYRKSIAEKIRMLMSIQN